MKFARRAEAAELDLQEIAFHIAIEHQQLHQADQIIDELITECERLATLSGISTLGTEASEIAIGVRLFSYKRWVILFRYEPHGVDVLRIADGSQDYMTWILE